ncbi:MAG: hypothetical protein GWN67_08170 [Phycisphaerae bacterium]|nr:hypothetical protein [Phycisphaerae bacterium]NIW92865.1 hypothetical protein [Phycisphaerae bacterium]
MKVRKLQRLNSAQQWEDHGYAFEREDGQCLFGYNTLVWGRIGAEYNVKLEKAGTKLEDVHQVIPATKRLRWLEIEEIEGEPEEIKATLDEACKIPRPQPKPAVT